MAWLFYEGFDDKLIGTELRGWDGKEGCNVTGINVTGGDNKEDCDKEATGTEIRGWDGNKGCK